MLDHDGEQTNAFTAAWVMQVSFSPLLLAFSINPKNRSYSMLRNSGVCAISVLKQNQIPLAQHFASSDVDKMTGYQWQYATSSAPILSESSAYFDCKVTQTVESGDHVIIVCEVIDAGYLQQRLPLLYSETGDIDRSSKMFK
ncbi:diguanylate cyclase [Methylococcaceae bacterium]|nr:diguanylate cyclase [Methylococcaceae bacterium]